MVLRILIILTFKNIVFIPYLSFLLMWVHFIFILLTFILRFGYILTILRFPFRQFFSCLSNELIIWFWYWFFSRFTEKSRKRSCLKISDRKFQIYSYTNKFTISICIGFFLLDIRQCLFIVWNRFMTRPIN